DNLMECRCTDGSRIWKIVTNLPDVKTGSKLACAILPPVEMMGIVSEAMFLGGTPLPESTDLGPLTDPPETSLDQARAQILQITKRMT
ncbi:MAG: tRNA-binding protein, partial [Candidatus Thorarchaeota archaeon]|nr:tRNA-binding protein [Candidatus Thorarchaeota archaeon]